MDPVNGFQSLALGVHHADDLSQHECRDAVAVELPVRCVPDDKPALLVGRYPGDRLFDPAAVGSATGFVSSRQEGQGGETHYAGIPAVPWREPAAIFELFGGEKFKTSVDSPGYRRGGVDLAKPGYSYPALFALRVFRGLFLRPRGLLLARERRRGED